MSDLATELKEIFSHESISIDRKHKGWIVEESSKDSMLKSCNISIGDYQIETLPSLFYKGLWENRIRKDQNLDCDGAALLSDQRKKETRILLVELKSTLSTKKIVKAAMQAVWSYLKINTFLQNCRSYNAPLALDIAICSECYKDEKQEKYFDEVYQKSLMKELSPEEKFVSRYINGNGEFTSLKLGDFWFLKPLPINDRIKEVKVQICLQKTLSYGSASVNLDLTELYSTKSHL